MTSAELIANLREENAQLRRLLKIEPSRLAEARFQRDMKLSRYEAVLLSVLHKAGGDCVPLERLEMTLPAFEGDDVRGLGVVRVHICRIRAKIGADAIRCAYGGGYLLTAVGLALCERVLREAA